LGAQAGVVRAGALEPRAALDHGNLEGRIEQRGNALPALRGEIVLHGHPGAPRTGPSNSARAWVGLADAVAPMARRSRFVHREAARGSIGRSPAMRRASCKDNDDSDSDGPSPRWGLWRSAAGTECAPRR